MAGSEYVSSEGRVKFFSGGRQEQFELLQLNIIAAYTP
jgi:hypothetical protein